MGLLLARTRSHERALRRAEHRLLTQLLRAYLAGPLAWAMKDPLRALMDAGVSAETSYAIASGGIMSCLSLGVLSAAFSRDLPRPDRISFIRAVRRSEEHTSELQSL